MSKLNPPASAPVSCPSESELADHVRRPPSSGDALAKHIASCQVCRGRLAALETRTRDAQGASPLSFTQALDAAGASPEGEVALAPVEPGRYRVGREVARGGMGKILEAWDVRHERLVAIKVLLDARAGAKWRFVREAQLTARLQHPSIIPVYEAGRWDDGEPFFAMKLVEGQSLAAVLAGAKTFEERMALLPHLVTATEAIAYAHARNVVHRDLKPSNVLVGAYGETMVIDWGLAKEVGDADPKRDTSSDERPAGATESGRALGTPGYMPPEQVRGDSIDARADVYALGAMMYQVFAGVMPYQGGSPEEVLRLVLAGPPKKIGEVEARLAPELVTIVEKAMSRDLEKRYPSAREMAEDLRRYANGQLVAAHEYSLGALTRRWVGRNRALVSAAVAAVIVFLVVGGISVRRIVRERDRADAAKVEAQREKGTAVTQREAAEKLVQFIVGDLKDRLEPLGKLDLLQGVGTEVVSYYDTLAPSDADLDLPALKRRAAAIGALASVESQRFDAAKDEALFRRRQQILRALLGRDSHDVETWASLIESDMTRGDGLYLEGRSPESRKLYNEGLDTAERALALIPGDAHLLVWRAFALTSVAERMSESGDAVGADAMNASASESLGQLGDVAALPAAWQDRIAETLSGVAFEDLRGHRLLKSVKTYERAVAIRDDLTRKGAGSAALTYESQSDIEEIAYLNDTLGRIRAEESILASSKKVMEDLCSREPTNAEWERELGRHRTVSCKAHRKLGELSDAEIDCRDAVATFRHMLMVRPDNPPDQKQLARALVTFADIFLARHDPVQGLSRLDDALRILTPVLERNPNDRGSVSYVLAARDGRATGLIALRRWNAATSELDAADATIAALGDRDMRLGARPEEFLVLRGDIDRGREDLEAAVAKYGAAIASLQHFIVQFPDDYEPKQDLASANIKLADLLRRRGAKDEARARDQAAVDLLQPYHDSGDLVPDDEALLASARRWL